MKTLKILSTAFFFVLFSLVYVQVQAQRPIAFYDKTEGIFKQNGGNLYIFIKKHQENDAYGNSSQGIQIRTATNATPVYYVRSEANQPNLYVMKGNKSFKYTFTSNNTVTFQFPGNSARFTRVATYTERLKIDGNDVMLKVQLVPNQRGVKFAFQKSARITWWKGIKIFNSRGQMISLLAAQDQDNGIKSSTVFSPSYLGSRVKIEFWKAKAFGVHTHMDTKYYNFQNWGELNMTFIWLND